VNHDQPAHPRQQVLRGALRCYYDDAYGPTHLCATCDAMRSAVGKGTVPRPVPGVELGRLIDAAQAVADAERDLASAAHAARDAGASWAQIGDALGLTRQAAQQRWGHH
jgi:hypothetical protein